MKKKKLKKKIKRLERELRHYSFNDSRRTVLKDCISFDTFLEKLRKSADDVLSKMEDHFD